MKLFELKCPNCGSVLQVSSDRNEVYCQYCGTKLLVDDGIHHIQYDNAEQAGYEFEKGRQRAQKEQQVNTLPAQQNYQSPVNKKKTKHTWLWVIGWIFFFPIPLTIIIASSKKLKPWVKAVLIIALWLTLIIAGYVEDSDNSTDSVVSDTSISETTDETEAAERIHYILK